MSSQAYPPYKNYIHGLEHAPVGQPRFYMNIAAATKTDLHHHDYAELAFYVGGSGTEWVNSKSKYITTGTVTFILPHQIHGLKSQIGEPLQKYRIMFDLQILYGKDKSSELTALIHHLGMRQYTWATLDVHGLGQMQSICNGLLEEYSRINDPEHDLMIRTKLTEALLLFSRASRQTVTSPLARSQDKENEMPTIMPILQYVHASYTSEITLDKTSELFHLSVPYTSRLFKEFTGKGFLEYVHFLRVEHAATLLRHTDISITDIAYEVGFESLRTFTRVFRKCTGLSASEYRASCPEHSPAGINWPG